MGHSRDTSRLCCSTSLHAMWRLWCLIGDTSRHIYAHSRTRTHTVIAWRRSSWHTSASSRLQLPCGYNVERPVARDQ
eukprot:2478957-Prymnesium_polylepis.1